MSTASRRKSKHGKIPKNDSSTLGFLDPISTLGAFRRFPISMLSALKVGILSGSRATPNASDPETSDFDFYHPWDTGSDDIVNFMCVLSFAGIKWNNSLQGRLEDVKEYGATVVPMETIIALAKAFPINTCKEDEFLKYLQNRFNIIPRSAEYYFLYRFWKIFQSVQEPST